VPDGKRAKRGKAAAAAPAPDVRLISPFTCAEELMYAQDDEKVKARAARFGTNTAAPAAAPAAGKKRKSPAPTPAVDAEEEERRRKRAERFGVPVAVRALPSYGIV
jgi:hypothetical protein